MRQTRASLDRVVTLEAVLGPGPWSLADVRAAGWTDSAVRAAVTAGRLVRPLRGVVSMPAAVDDPLHAIAAAVLVSGRDAVISHDSAIRWHRLWEPRRMSALVHLTDPGEPGRTARGVRIHRSSLPAPFVTSVDGRLVTSLARTAADAARGRSLADAVVIVDSAARRILADLLGVAPIALRDPGARRQLRDLAVEALEEAADSVGGWPGSRVLREAITAVDPASESPFESWSRVWIQASSLPRPDTAYAVQGASGRWYVADFAWPDRRVLGEADGIGKYGTDGTGVARALRAERLRQRDLEDAGWTVVRWDTAERPRAMVARLGAALSSTA